MDVPSKLKIGAIEYSVVIADTDACGRLDRTQNKILISRELAANQQWVTLIHEIIHGLNSELRESVVDSLAVGFHQVLVDNGLLQD